MILSVGESHPKHWKPGAALIKWAEGTDHTHSFTSWRDDVLDIRKVLEARGSGGRLVTNRQFRKENHVVRVFQYPLDNEKTKELEKWAWEHLEPYGYKALLGLGIMRIERLWNKTAGNRFKDGDFSMVCVELTAKAIALSTGIAMPGNVEDYGLREMHEINYEHFKNGKCDLMPQDQIDKINAG